MKIISKIAENSYVAWLKIAQQIDENFAELQSSIGGNPGGSVDLSSYVSKTELNETLSDYATKEDLNSLDIQSNEVKVDTSANSIVADGTKYTINVTDNVISVSQYVATTISELSLSNINVTKTQKGGGNYYIGTTYTLVCGIDVTSDNQTLNVQISNPTNNEYKVSVHNGVSYIYQDAEYHTDANTITVSGITVMNDVQNSTIVGTVSWGSKTNTVKTSGEKTFTVYLTEKGKETVSKQIKQTQISASSTANAMVPIVKGIDGTPENCSTVIKDVVYNESVSDLGTVSWATGECPTIAVPTCLNKKLTGYDAASGMKDNSWGIIKTVTYTINGCLTEYNIYAVLTNDEPTPVIGKTAEYIIKLS